MDSFSWRAQPFSWELAQRLADELSLPLLVGIVLARRGFTSVAEARAFLEVDDRVPDPFLLGGMQRAVQALSRAVTSGQRVVVHGDYDVDGVSATALLLRGLSRFGVQAESYLPSRFGYGYGLSRGALREIAESGPGLLVTVDCGVAYPDEVDYARELGFDVVVTDHHQLTERLPDCPVVHAAVGAYPHKDLCGVGVALKLLHGLHVMLEGTAPDKLPPALLEHLDLVALGTVADLVPLLGENRYYVKQGLVRLASTDKVGLRELLRVSRAEGVLDSTVIGYRLAPRLNAGGRLEGAEKPLRLLMTDDRQEAAALAEELDALNRRRQEVEGRIFQEAAGLVEQMDDLPPALVLPGEGWHEGVIGIVASRLVERYRRPSILLSLKDGSARGSGRSIPAFDLVGGLGTCADLLDQYGGHHQAAGLTVSELNLEAFSQRFTAHAGAVLCEEDFLRSFSPDAVARGSDLTLETVDALSRLAPFGQGNPPVHLLVVDAEVADPQQTRSGDHLRCSVTVDGIRARGIGFGLARTIPDLELDARCHAGVMLRANDWQGLSRAEVELHSLYRPRDLGQLALGCSPECPYLDDLSAPAPCSHCSEPFGEVTRPVPLRGRDLRSTGASASDLAQVLSSGESAALITASVPHRLGEITSRLPLMELGVAGVTCLSRNCWRTRSEYLPAECLLFTDWTAAERRSSLLFDKRHVVVLDPPFTPGQTAMLSELAQAGALLHLAYGPAERRFTEHVISLLLHPRPLMVALYRAWQRGLGGGEAYMAVIRQAFAEHRLLPAGDDLQRAEGLLRELGFTPDSTERSTIEVTDLPAYRAAEAVYEEALRLCRTL